MNRLDPKITKGRRFSVFTQLTIWISLATILSIGVPSYISYISSVAAIEANVFQAFEVMAEEKVQRIARYFDEKKDDVRTLARQPETISTLRKLRDSDRTGDAWKISEEVSDYLSFVIQAYGYHDLFLIQPSGNIAFAASQEGGMKTNLMTGPYSGSSLATMVRKTMMDDSTHFSKLEYFEPCQMYSVSVCAVVLDSGQVLGAIVLQLADSNILSIVEKNKPIGKSGEIIIGTKKGENVLYLNPLFTDSIAAYTKEIKIGSDYGLPMQYAVQGQNGSGVANDYSNIPILAAWRYLPELDWGLVVKIYKDEALAPIADALRMHLLYGFIEVLVMLVLVYFASRSITTPLIQLKGRTDAMAKGDLTVRAEVSSNDEIGELASSFNDMIAARWNAEETIRMERAQLLSVFECLDETAYVADTNTYEILFMNAVAQKTWGKAVGSKCFKTLHGFDSPCKYCTNENIMGENIGQSCSFEYENELNNNCYRGVAKAIRWPDGRIVRVDLAIDITKSRQNEIELRKYRDHLEGLVKERSEEIVTTNLLLQNELAERTLLEVDINIRNTIDRIFLENNTEEAYSRILNTVVKALDSKYGSFGYIDEQGALVQPTMTRDIWDKCQIDNESRVFPRDTWGDSLWPRAMRQGKTLCSNEPSTHTPIGHMKFSRSIASAIVYKSESIGLIQIANKSADYDDTDTRRMTMISNSIAPILATRLENKRNEIKLRNIHSELESFSEELQRSNRELEEFARIASHDLQEPLRKVQAFSERIYTKYSDQIGEQGKDYMDRMLGAVSRMRALIDDLLTYARVTSKAKRFTSVELDDVAREVISDLEQLISRVDGEVKLDNLPCIAADRSQMRQLLQNLIGNALKFRKEDEPPTVNISSRRVEENSASQDGYCEITVRDNGIGFDEKYLDIIFLPFRRLHGRTEYEGTGIGLAVCQKIVGRHHGSLIAHSVKGQGSIFVIKLPIHQRNSGEIECKIT